MADPLDDKATQDVANFQPTQGTDSLSLLAALLSAYFPQGSKGTAPSPSAGAAATGDLTKLDPSKAWMTAPAIGTSSLIQFNPATGDFRQLDPKGRVVRSGGEQIAFPRTPETTDWTSGGGSGRTSGGEIDPAFNQWLSQAQGVWSLAQQLVPMLRSFQSSSTASQTPSPGNLLYTPPTSSAPITQAQASLAGQQQHMMAPTLSSPTTASPSSAGAVPALTPSAPSAAAAPVVPATPAATTAPLSSAASLGSPQNAKVFVNRDLMPPGSSAGGTPAQNQQALLAGNMTPSAIMALGSSPQASAGNLAGTRTDIMPQGAASPPASAPAAPIVPMASPGRFVQPSGAPTSSGAYGTVGGLMSGAPASAGTPVNLGSLPGPNVAGAGAYGTVGDFASGAPASAGTAGSLGKAPGGGVFGTNMSGQQFAGQMGDLSSGLSKAIGMMFAGGYGGNPTPPPLPMAPNFQYPMMT